jgi:hypothetical protein
MEIGFHHVVPSMTRARGRGEEGNAVWAEWDCAGHGGCEVGGSNVGVGFFAMTGEEMKEWHYG